MSDPIDLRRFPIHLGLGATAMPEPEFSGIEWYEAYLQRHADDGADARIVSLYEFSQDWDTWEMHPEGEEVVLCIVGRMMIHQEHADGATDFVSIGPGEYVVNPRGTWHTADIPHQATALFITAGRGTRHRPRDDL